MSAQLSNAIATAEGPAPAPSSATAAPTATAAPRATTGAAAATVIAAAPTLIGSAKAITAVALALGTFMQVLDTSIANVSIPTISGDLGVSSDQGTWVITSFAVANGVSVPLTGWLMQRFGVVRTFVASVVLFTIASMLCGLAWSLPSLIMFRVLQGAVSGPMIPGSQALLIDVFGPAKRATALTIWSLTTLIAPIAGPLLGGYISDNYVWPWIFLINVPVGIFCAYVCWTKLKAHETATRKLPIDRVGLALLFIWVGALQIMLDQGKDLDWFSSPLIVALLVVTAISFAAWLIWNLTEQHPVVDLSLFKSRSFTLGTVALCLGYAVFFGNIVLMPLWLQSYLGYTATWAGVVSAPSGVTAVITSLFVGRLMRRYDPRMLAAASFALYAASYFMRAGLTADAGVFAFVAPQLVQGFAMGLFFVSMLAVIFDGLPPQKIPSASGLSNFLRITAGSFATSLTTTFWDRREALHQTRLSDAVSVYAPAYQEALGQLHQLGVGDQAAAAALTRGLVGQSYLMSSIDLFYISAWLCVALLPLCFLVRRPAATGAAPVAAD
ncbi:MAG TPA: DHA2 family efflux MFS transporter permease subunit [Steroidobacteraceae bacterium]|jgi:DHA2 family multidrug resistance protein|nr:DHA2 family efflux MFS transporter permease subunit [Steroidobacteraceae bacterium]